MGKSQNRGNREDKKKATRTLKEKRAAKRTRHQQGDAPLIQKHQPRED